MGGPWRAPAPPRPAILPAREATPPPVRDHWIWAATGGALGLVAGAALILLMLARGWM